MEKCLGNNTIIIWAKVVKRLTHSGERSRSNMQEEKEDGKKKVKKAWGEEALQLSRMRYPAFLLPDEWGHPSWRLPVHARQQFFLSTLRPDFIFPVGSKQGLAWPATWGFVSLSDTALSATLSVAAASLPPVE